MKRTVIYALTFMMVFTLFIPVFANDMDELREKQEQIRDQVEGTKSELSQREAEVSNISQELSRINSRIAEVENELNILEARVEEAELKVEVAEEELEKIQQELDEKIAIFKDRLVEIYKNGNLNMGEMLTNSKSFTDFLVQMELVKRMAVNDIDMLEEIEEAYREQEIKKHELDRQRAEVVALKGEVEVQMAALEDRRSEQQEFLAAAREEQEFIEKVLREEEEAQRQVSEMIRKLELEQRGLDGSAPTQLAWPTPGYSRITSDYGWRTHPILRDRRLHTGIDIGAPMGVQVVAAADGRVVHTGWHGGYGLTVIMMHGGGTSTLYAHLSNISVSNNQSVSRGQQVGNIGTTGLSTGPHLHFEVLKNGQHTSPWQYLR